MTTNCIVPPKDSYKNRIYTTGAVRYPGCPHIDGVIGETKDFSLLIEQAKHCAPPTELEQGTIVGGFAHAQVLALADQIVDAVKSGAIKNSLSWLDVTAVQRAAAITLILHRHCRKTP